MPANLSKAILDALKFGWDTTSKEYRDGYNGGSYPNLPSFTISGRLFFVSVAPGQEAVASPYTTVTGWTEVVGHYEYDHFDLSGVFQYHSSGSNAVRDLVSVGLVIAGGYTFGTYVAPALGLSAPVAATTAATVAPVAATTVATTVASTAPVISSTAAKLFGTAATLLGGAGASSSSPGATGSNTGVTKNPYDFTQSTTGAAGQGMNPMIIVAALAALALAS